MIHFEVGLGLVALEPADVARDLGVQALQALLDRRPAAVRIYPHKRELPLGPSWSASWRAGR